MDVIHVESRRKRLSTLQHLHPGAVILDLTSRGEAPWVKFSPFYPHGGIPVPFSPGETAESVEGIWQALKVFEGAGVDRAKLAITAMSGIKRTSRRLGKVLGHLHGLAGERLLDYRTARRTIYLPTYRWVLEHRLATELQSLRDLADKGDIVLLDYETNGDPDDLTSPLSHAQLVRRFVTGDWPEG